MDGYAEEHVSSITIESILIFGKIMLLNDVFLQVLYPYSIHIFSGDYTSPAYGTYTPAKNNYVNQIYSYKYDCSNYAKTCNNQRKECQEYSQNYYATAYEQQGYEHKDCEGNSWTGTSYIDPRPYTSEKYDQYVDYLNGYTTRERPSHGHYGRLPYTKVQDPSCRELQNIIEGICRNNEGSSDGKDKYDLGQICGFGTTWDPVRKRCVRMQNDYTTYDGTGYQHERPVYPYIRAEGDERCYDNPDDIYLYLDKEQQQTYNSVPHGTENCTPTYPDENVQLTDVDSP